MQTQGGGSLRPPPLCSLFHTHTRPINQPKYKKKRGLRPSLLHNADQDVML